MAGTRLVAPDLEHVDALGKDFLPAPRARRRGHGKVAHGHVELDGGGALGGDGRGGAGRDQLGLVGREHGPGVYREVVPLGRGGCVGDVGNNGPATGAEVLVDGRGERADGRRALAELGGEGGEGAGVGKAGDVFDL